MKNKIYILDPLIANQIAAGEVIERPASIVKELVENSLDAGATNLIIDIAQGGVNLIRIRDNGMGIHKEDLPLAVQRYGTSKIQTLEDLTAIASFGFRGEALASITAVSQVEINSSVDGEQGWQLIAEGCENKILEKPIAHPIGTTIIVRNLFFNVPVRRKFLRSEKTEFLHIESLVKRIGLSHFSLNIQLTHNDRTILNLKSAQNELSQLRRLQQLCGKAFVDNIVKIDMHASGLRLWGWIVTPNYVGFSKEVQYLAINGRIVRDKLVNHAIRLGYQQKTVLLNNVAYVLFLECDPALVDVNIHPTKSEVKFRDGRLIHDFIYVSIRNALNQQNSVTMEPSVTKNTTENLPITHAIAEPKAHYGIQKTNILGEAFICLDNRLLLAHHDQKLIIVDIIQARKLIYLDELLIQMQHNNSRSLTLMFPLRILLSAAVVTELIKLQDILKKIAFDFDWLSKNEIVLRKVPRLFQHIDYEKFFVTLDNSEFESTENACLEAIAFHAAKHSNPLEIAEYNDILRVIEKKDLQSLPYKIFTINDLSKFLP